VILEDVILYLNVDLNTFVVCTGVVLKAGCGWGSRSCFWVEDGVVFDAWRYVKIFSVIEHFLISVSHVS
jgi:hypothetical protein